MRDALLLVTRLWDGSVRCTPMRDPAYETATYEIAGYERPGYEKHAYETHA